MNSDLQNSDLQLALDLFRALSTLVPAILPAVSAIEAVFSGTAGPDDRAKIDAARDAVNALADAAEQKVIGQPARGE